MFALHRLGKTMDRKRIEIVRVDPKRWAWLHLPLGLLLGIAFVVWYFIQEEGVDIEMFAEGAVCIVFVMPSIVIATMAAAWLQAAIMNLYFVAMRCGPIVEIRDIEDDKSPRWKSANKAARSAPQEKSAPASEEAPD